MDKPSSSLLARFAQYGVVSRDAVKNVLAVIRKMARLGLVQRIRKRHRVFYELTPRALPLLDAQREILLAQARQCAQLAPKSSAYRALLSDIRFFNPDHPAAQAFLFLGDWDLQRPAARYQLALAQARFYAAHE